MRDRIGHFGYHYQPQLGRVRCAGNPKSSGVKDVEGRAWLSPWGCCAGEWLVLLEWSAASAQEPLSDKFKECNKYVKRCFNRTHSKIKKRQPLLLLTKFLYTKNKRRPYESSGLCAHFVTTYHLCVCVVCRCQGAVCTVHCVVLQCACVCRHLRIHDSRLWTTHTHSIAEHAQWAPSPLPPLHACSILHCSKIHLQRANAARTVISRSFFPALSCSSFVCVSLGLLLFRTIFFFGCHQQWIIAKRLRSIAASAAGTRAHRLPVSV